MDGGKFRRSLLVCGVVAAVSGCAQDPAVAPPEAEGPDCTITGTDRFLTLATGTEWTHSRTSLNGGSDDQKTQVVGALEDIGGDKAGIVAYQVTMTKDNGKTVWWQESTDMEVVRHRKQDLSGSTHHDEIFDEFKPVIDESPDRLAEGGSYEITYVETSTNLMTDETVSSRKVEEWTVAREGEKVTVPAGTFCTMQLRRVTKIDGAVDSEKQYWYARGVGKVKERSSNQREELISYRR